MIVPCSLFSLLSCHPRHFLFALSTLQATPILPVSRFFEPFHLVQRRRTDYISPAESSVSRPICRNAIPYKSADFLEIVTHRHPPLSVVPAETPRLEKFLGDNDGTQDCGVSTKNDGAQVATSPVSIDSRRDFMEMIYERDNYLES